MSVWIGVDFDGTLAKYGQGNHGDLGEPVPLMVARVKGWLANGLRVKIMTARACTGDVFEISRIRAWCKENIGQELEVTATKDFEMMELWDDRAIRVEMNTGKVI